MKTVLLGAGASRAESSDMPLVSDFFRTIVAHASYADEAMLRNVLQVVTTRFGISAHDVRTDSVNVEELLTLLECESAWHGSDADLERQQSRLVPEMVTLTTHDNLVELIAAALLNRQHEAIASETLLHRRLSRLLASGDTIVSFNYDLIADWALFEEGLSNEINYRVPFLIRTETAGAPYLESLPATVSAAGAVDLLKLHGSLNWFQRKWKTRASEILPPDALVYLQTSHANLATANMMIQDPDGSPVPLIPAIVAPTFSKMPLWSEFAGAFRELWLRAHTAIRQADHVALIGYSLREADYLSNWLLRSATAAGTPNRQIWIANPCASDRQRIANALRGGGSINEVEDFEEYLNRHAT